jgi:hypothetical protein
MRAIVIVCTAAVVWFAGCGRDRDATKLAREPLDALPQGACMVLVASDLADTWERARTHDALRAFRAVVPYLRSLEAPVVKEFLAELDSFETKSGSRVHEDLLLNVFGQRVAIGVYAGEPGPDVLCVSELRDAGRFQRVLDALQRDSTHKNLQFEATSLDGRATTRIRAKNSEHDIEWLVAHDDGVLVMCSSEALARRAWRIQARQPEPTALGEQAFRDALAGLGPHDIALLELRPGSVTSRWAAQGLSWTDDGLHFRRTLSVQPAGEAPPLETPVRRAEILQSFPRGMTLVYYARPTEPALLRELFTSIGSCTAVDGDATDEESRRSDAWPDAATRLAAGVAPWPALQPAAAPPPLGMSSLPFDLERDVLPWCGDEMALVFAELTTQGIVPVPSAALIVEVADAKLAQATLRDLERNLTHLPFGTISEGFVDVRYGGQTYRSFAQPFLETASPSYWIDADVVVISTTRELLQQIIDTRRVGNRHMLNDASFVPFEAFVPADAQAAAYADQRRLYRAMAQILELPRAWGVWGRDLTRLVKLLDDVSVLFQLFPSSAVYVMRSDTAITLDAWMLESR